MNQDMNGPEGPTPLERDVRTLIPVELEFVPKPWEILVARLPHSHKQPADLYVYDPRELATTTHILQFAADSQAWIIAASTPPTVLGIDPGDREDIVNTLGMLDVYKDTFLAPPNAHAPVGKGPGQEIRRILQSKLGLPPVVIPQDFIHQTEQIKDLTDHALRIYDLGQENPPDFEVQAALLAEKLRNTIADGLLEPSYRYLKGQALVAVEQNLDARGRGSIRFNK